MDTEDCLYDVTDTAPVVGITGYDTMSNDQVILYRIEKQLPSQFIIVYRHSFNTYFEKSLAFNWAPEAYLTNLATV